MVMLKELGLDGALMRVPHVTKYGAEFGIGDNPATRSFTFRNGLIPGVPVFNIERAVFDKMLIDEAKAAGVEVFEETTVKSIVNLEREDVRLGTPKGVFRGRVLLDCSGQGTLLGRALNLRQGFQEKDLQKVAYYQHFTGVERNKGEMVGHATIIMCDEGWFWIFALNETKTSVGFVSHPWFTKELNVPPKKLLAWAVARCPIVRHRMRDAVGPSENVIISDFSYRCRPYAGKDGAYFMIGDAACFLDPIFSAGVTLAMVNAQQTSPIVASMLRGQTTPEVAMKKHIRFLQKSTGPFWRLNRAYYKHNFRELFMHGQGPFQMQNALISVLAGQVFPQPVWKLAWRHRAFELCVWLQKYFALVPRRKPCKLVEQDPVPRPWTELETPPVEVVTRPVQSAAMPA
jgi:2-polyprenyl-6-methoxyphenol hydroxylase-like FAD-dependent oxidoreductase